MEKSVCLLVLTKTGEREILSLWPCCYRGISNKREEETKPIKCADVDLPGGLLGELAVALSRCTDIGVEVSIANMAFPPGIPILRVLLKFPFSPYHWVGHQSLDRYIDLKQISLKIIIIKRRKREHSIPIP